MDIKSFEQIVKTENSAHKYLLKSCWKYYRRYCQRCRSRRLYRIRRNRYRCSQCNYEFSEFTGRWINQLNISAKEWLWLIKLFELEVSAHKAAKQIGLSYPTVLKAFNVIRESITAHLECGDMILNGEIEADEDHSAGRRKGRRARIAINKIPVFGILDRKGSVIVDVVKDISVESILDLAVKTAKRGSIVYTSKFKNYDSLMFCGYKQLRIDHAKRFAQSKVYIDGLEGFWSYAKERLIKFHGVSKEYFPIYLKEMEFRYNNRNQPIFSTLVQYLCNFVAKPV